MTQITKEEIIKSKNEIIQTYGEWTIDRHHLGFGIYTCESSKSMNRADVIKISKSILKDFGYINFNGLRILDLACLEGIIALEYSKMGAETIGIEGRKANVIKAQFVQEIQGLLNCKILHDDVRNLCPKKHGTFHIVFCSGILYHLDMPDACILLENIRKVCTGVCIVDTHYSPTSVFNNSFPLSEKASFVYKKHTYEGRFYKEHDKGITNREKEKSLWSSLDNNKSFWFTKHSLLKAIKNAGFGNIYESKWAINKKNDIIQDRITLICKSQDLI